MARTRRDAARDRLWALAPSARSDSELASAVLDRLAKDVLGRGDELTEEEANDLVSDEVAKLRDEKRGPVNMIR